MWLSLSMSPYTILLFRKIYARKRLINSQIATSDRSAWYYQYHDYGCYCVAPTDDKKSRGKPVDAIDRISYKIPNNIYLLIWFGVRNRFLI